MGWPLRWPLRDQRSECDRHTVLSARSAGARYSYGSNSGGHANGFDQLGRGHDRMSYDSTGNLMTSFDHGQRFSCGDTAAAGGGATPTCGSYDALVWLGRRFSCGGRRRRNTPAAAAHLHAAVTQLFTRVVGSARARRILTGRTNDHLERNWMAVAHDRANCTAISHTNCSFDCHLARAIARQQLQHSYCHLTHTNCNTRTAISPDTTARAHLWNDRNLPSQVWLRRRRARQ